MVARTRTEPDALVVQFDRDGEESQKELVVGSGERVLLHAGALLVRRRELRLHDQLTIRESGGGCGYPGVIPAFCPFVRWTGSGAESGELRCPPDHAGQRRRRFGRNASPPGRTATRKTPASVLE